MSENKQHYGLMTAISMIVGISVGSGIFFKVDDILVATAGNIFLSVVVFIIGALCIIFGSITISQLASISNKRGGIIGYYEEYVSPRVASGFGWFQLFAYYPTIAVVVSWVAGSYTSTLLDIDSSLELDIFIGIFYLIFFYILNYFSLKLGGYFQNIATVIKLVPLFGIGIIALFWNEPQPALPQQIIQTFDQSTWGWLAALAPMAFSYDGWVVSTSITHEVKNAQRTMPIALTIGPIIVLIVYLFYFLGMVSIAGTDYIIQMGDNAIYAIGNQVLGEYGGTIIVLFILVAILGVVNGIVLGHIRIPQLLAEKNMLPHSEKIKQTDPNTGLSFRAMLIALVISLIWFFIHYLTQKTNALSGGDVSEIAIVFSYLAYIILYVKVFQLYRQNTLQNFWFAGVFPFLAAFGSLIIVLGGIISNVVYVPIFMIICALIMLLGSNMYSKWN